MSTTKTTKTAKNDGYYFSLVSCQEAFCTSFYPSWRIESCVECIQKCYKWWLWWSRIGYLVAAVQVVGAAYFFFLIAMKASQRFAYTCSGSGGENLPPSSSVCLIEVHDHSQLNIASRKVPLTGVLNVEVDNEHENGAECDTVWLATTCFQ
jgi:hypothetical protein